MNEKLKIKNAKWRAAVRAALIFNFAFFIFNSGAAEGTNATEATAHNTGTNVVAQAEKVPVTPREFFNAGTRRLAEGKLREAENYFQAALAEQQIPLQAPALHNLGHVRYQQGAEELKKSPESNAAMQRSQRALERGDAALRQAEDALLGEDEQKLIRAYLNGRGARRELRETMDLVRRALEAHGAALQKWQRALGDFQSALELNPADPKAPENIKIIEEAIARLLDKMRQMAQLGQMMGQQRQALGDLMSEIRGRVPAMNAPPGEDGEEEEEDDAPYGPREGQEQRRGPDGEERGLSPEEAGWLLESFQLGGNRQLPMGQGEPKEPRERKGRNW
jgi:tetratricopeptide (TPR) repeat protein